MNTQDITPFLFEGQSLLRVVTRDGDPWFVAADICRILGLSNPTKAVASLDDDEKANFKLGFSAPGSDATFLSEGGMYTLILRSRQATTPGTVPHRLRKFVTGEVLPQIRKTGAYAQPGFSDEAETDPSVETSENEHLRLRKVTVVSDIFGKKAGRQMWLKLKLETVPAMFEPPVQADLFEVIDPGAKPASNGNITITVPFPPNGMSNGHVDGKGGAA